MSMIDLRFRDLACLPREGMNGRVFLTQHSKCVSCASPVRFAQCLDALADTLILGKFKAFLEAEGRYVHLYVFVSPQSQFPAAAIHDGVAPATQLKACTLHDPPICRADQPVLATILANQDSEECEGQRNRRTAGDDDAASSELKVRTRSSS